jgi:hypothetical protein
MRAGADDVAIREKAAVGARVDLPGRALFDQAVLLEPAREVFRQLVVLR